MKPSIASMKLVDLLRPQSNGETVNVHVVDSVKEPKPDFDAMKRVIEEKSDFPTRDETKRAAAKV